MNIRNFKRLSLFITIVITLVVQSIVTTYAVSYSVSVSAKTVKSGGSVTVSISGNGCEGSFKVSASNGAKVTGSNPIWTGESTTVKAGSSNFTITVTPVSVTNSSDASKVTNLSSKSVSISVQSANNNSNNNNNNNDDANNNTTQNLSSENSLSSLKVSTGSLTPAFSANQTSYKVEVGGDVTEIKVSASPKDSKAKVSGTGTKELKIGNNEIKVVCTAENGSKKTYTLNVHVNEDPLIYTQFNDVKLGVVRSLDGVDIPKGFKANKITLDDQEIDGFTHENFEMNIAYLIDEEGNSDFYIIVDGHVDSLYKTIVLDNRTFIIVDIPSDVKDREGMIYQEVTINDKTLDGWVYENEQWKDYYLLYLMSSEDGKISDYQYEVSEGTIQKYMDIADSNDDYKINKITIIFIITTLLFNALSIGVLIYLRNLKKNHSVK